MAALNEKDRAVAIIREDDFIKSIADALRYISCYHPADFIRHMSAAYDREQSASAKDAIGQILLNSRMAALGRRPICQDTGMVNVFLKVGVGARFDTKRGLSDLVNEGVRQAYLDEHNPLRASVLDDPLFLRKNTKDNTPAVVYTEIVEGDHVDITVAAKGGGSENKAKFTVLNPSDSVVDWVVSTVEKLGAGWCPPGVLGIGAGGSSEKALLLAKEALMEPLDMFDLLKRGPANKEEEMRLEIMEKVNALGIGAQGLGGLTTILDVKIKTFPTHAASLPVGIIPNCAATRHMHFHLDGSGPAQFSPPDLKDWPQIVVDKAAQNFKRVNLDTLTPAEVANWQPGERLLLSGTMLTGRDAAHKRMCDMIARGEPMPVDMKNKVIYYVGPVDAVGDEAVGPAGPTTATRMDKFTETVLANTGLIAMVGKAERGPAAIEAIKKHKAAYLMGVGGAAYLISKSIKAAKVVAFADLGMEAIHEFVVEEMPVTVAVDAGGTSVHNTGPAQWRRAP